MTLIDKEHQLFFQTYKRLPIEVTKGEGCYLYAEDGKRYLDMFAGLAVNALGYAHPAVIAAIEAQIRKYNHLSNYFLQTPQIELADLLLKESGFARLFFTNSGTEAIEGTIKLVRKWGSKEGRKKIFGMTNGFSGRSMGALSLMDKEKYREGYGPFLPDVFHIAFNDPEDLRKKVDSSTIAVFLEFIQGEGGVVPVTPQFVAALKELQRSYGFLVVADEIQSGIGRTGKFFAYEHFGFHPDVVTVAKPIGGGLPLGAILGSDRVSSVWTYGVHGTTFGGNPVACAAGKALLETLLRPEFKAGVEKISAYLWDGLRGLQKKHPVIREIRGFGMMIGVDLSRESGPVVDEMLRRGVLVNATAGTVVRILPPLIAGEREVDLLLSTFGDVLSSMNS